MDFDTVVMKFGGSSVADPAKIQHVARRLVEAKELFLRLSTDENLAEFLTLPAYEKLT